MATEEMKLVDIVVPAGTSWSPPPDLPVDLMRFESRRNEDGSTHLQGWVKPACPSTHEGFPCVFAEGHDGDHQTTRIIRWRR